MCASVTPILFEMGYMHVLISPVGCLALKHYELPMSV